MVYWFKSTAMLRFSPQIHLYEVCDVFNGQSLTASHLRSNAQSLQNLICQDQAYLFLRQIPGTPPYWQKFMYEVVAMVKQLGIPTWFMTLSCADVNFHVFPLSDVFLLQYHFFLKLKREKEDHQNSIELEIKNGSFQSKNMIQLIIIWGYKFRPLRGPIRIFSFHRGPVQP